MGEEYQNMTAIGYVNASSRVSYLEEGEALADTQTDSFSQWVIVYHSLRNTLLHSLLKDYVQICQSNCVSKLASSFLAALKQKTNFNQFDSNDNSRLVFRLLCL